MRTLAILFVVALCGLAAIGCGSDGFSCGGPCDGCFDDFDCCGSFQCLDFGPGGFLCANPGDTCFTP
jgi:hypothetical protein